MQLKFPNYEAIEKWAKNNPLVVSIMVILVICSSVLTLISNSHEIYNRARIVLFPDSIQNQKFAKLSTNTTIEYFTSILGAPQFRNIYGNRREYLYVHEKYYVQAITDQDDSVLAYSITTRKKDFNPVFDLKDYTGNNLNFKVILGKTTFADLQHIPTSLNSGFGARRQWYHESYYFGNPGLYLTYIVAHADAGGFMPHGAHQVNGISMQMINEADWAKVDSRVKGFRQRCPINTFCFSMAFDIFEDPNSFFEIGVDYDTVRVLNRE